MHKPNALPCDHCVILQPGPTRATHPPVSTVAPVTTSSSSTPVLVQVDTLGPTVKVGTKWSASYPSEICSSSIPGLSSVLHTKDKNLLIKS